MKENKANYNLGISFVTFKTKRMADFIEQKWGAKAGFILLRFIKSVTGTKYRYTFTKDGKEESSRLKIMRAPDPADIIWENQGVSYKELISTRTWTFICTFLLLCLSFGAILGLKILQYELYSEAKIDVVGLRVISIIIAMTIFGINEVLIYMIKVLTNAEKHYTSTSYFQSLMVKTVIAQMLNSNLMVIIVHVIVYKPRIAIYGQGALMTDAWFILLQQAFVGPLLQFYSVRSVWRKSQRSYYRKQMMKDPKKVVLTQEEAHKIFENPTFNPCEAHSDFVLIFITMVFFQPVLPMGTFTGLIGLVLTYYSYKKKLVKDSKRPVMVSKDIALITLYLLSLSPLVFGVRTDHPGFFCHL